MFLCSSSWASCAEEALCTRKLISWVCQAAMRGSGYRSQVQRWQADDDSRVRFPSRRQKFVIGCRDCRHTWDSWRFQTPSDKTGGRGRLCSLHRCRMSQDKGLSVGDAETRRTLRHAAWNVRASNNQHREPQSCEENSSTTRHWMDLKSSKRNI